MSRDLGVLSQRVVGVVNAAPSGITSELLYHLCSRPACDAKQDMPQGAFRTRIGWLLSRGFICRDGDVFYPTDQSEPALTKALRPPTRSDDLPETNGWLGANAAARYLGWHRSKFSHRAAAGLIERRRNKRGQWRYRITDLNEIKESDDQD